MIGLYTAKYAHAQVLLRSLLDNRLSGPLITAQYARAAGTFKELINLLVPRVLLKDKELIK